MATKKYLDNTGLSYFWSKIKALIPTTWAASSTANGVATKAASIPFGKVDSTSTSTAFTATVNGITELSDGVCVMLKNGVVTSASGWTLNVNGLGAKPVYRSFAASSRTTTWFNVNYTMLFVYNSTRITGGCWDMFEGYWSDSNNVGVYNRPTYVRLKTKTNLYRYQMLLSYSDTELLPINAVSNDTGTSKTLTTESFDPFGPIYYYYNESTVNANAVIPDSRLWAQRDMNLRYSFNTGTTLTANKSIYLVAVPQDDGKAKLYSEPIAQEIPATDNGLIYIYLGTAYSNYQLQLNEKHPIYYYKNGAVRLWTNAPSGVNPDNYYDKYDIEQITKSDYSNTHTELLTAVTLPASSSVKVMDYPEDGEWNSNTTRILMVKEDGNLVDSTLLPVTCNSDGIYVENTEEESVTVDLEIIIANKLAFRNSSVFYGVCNSSAQSSALEVTTNYFYTIYPGMQLLVKFVNGIKNANQGLWVNGNYVGNIANDTNETGVAYDVRENQLVNMVFDGTYWHMLGTREANTTWYGITKLVDSVSSTSTSAAATPNSVKQAYDLASGKQDALVSGTNIKTINGTSILGSGNIEISGGGGSTTNQKTWYGTSTTSASSSTKVVTCEGFTLEDGAHISVFFKNENTYKSLAYLNVNGTGAILISQTTGSGIAQYMWHAGEVVDFVYSSTNEKWFFVHRATATTTYYGPTKLSSSTSSTSTSLAATPSAVKAAYDLASGKQDALVSGTNIKTINGTSILGSGNIEISGEGSTTDIVNLIYPVGSIYMSVNSTNPKTLFGGTWTQIAQGRTLVGVDTSDTNFNTAEKTGGEKTHTLTVAELPSHRHEKLYNQNGTTERKAGYGSTGTHTGTLNQNTNTTFESLNTGYTGGGQAHNNLQPYFTCYIWKRTA